MHDNFVKPRPNRPASIPNGLYFATVSQGSRRVTTRIVVTD
jgi:hypothetical protein